MHSSSPVDKIMNADTEFKFPLGFPPDPGASGKKTLIGIDSDHDGLRDDLQRWIHARFPNEPKKRSALKQLAISYMSSLQVGTDKKALQDHFTSMGRSVDCLYLTFGERESIRELEYLRAKALNTEMRTKKFLETDHLLDGMSSGPITDDDGDPCDG